MAIGRIANAEGICPAGEIVIKRAGIGTAAVIGSGSKADGKITVAGAGGVLKGCVVGVTFLAVFHTAITQKMFGMAAGLAS